MSAHESESRPSIGKITRKGIRRHYDDISQAAFVRLLIWAAVFAPLILSKIMPSRLPIAFAAAISLAIYVFGLIPMRFWARQKIRRVYYRHTNYVKKQSGVYARWMTTGLLRYLRGILWGLPFIACVVYFTVLRSILDAPTFNAPIHWLAMLLAGNPENNVGNVPLAWGIVAGLVAFFGLLFAYGWWRDLPFEYLPVRSIGAGKTLHWSRRILKKYRRRMLGNTFVNFLLSLPGILGFGTVLGLYAMKKVNFSLSMEMVLAQVKNLFTQPVPKLVLLELLAVFAVLYLPLCIYRKCRNAALMGRCMRSHHSHDHKEEVKQEAEEKAEPEQKEEKPQENKAEKAEAKKDEHAAG